MRPAAGYILSGVFVLAFTVLPYVFPRAYSADRDTYYFAFAIGWLISITGTVHFASRVPVKRWWFALSTPVALFRVGESILLMLFFLYWRLTGQGL